MKKSEETKTKLLEVATFLIQQSNYDSVGVNEICKKAGVTKGGFYYHFETKADLFYECSVHYRQNKMKKYEDIFSSESSLDQLRNFIDFLLNSQKNTQSKNPVNGCPFISSGALCCNEEEKIRRAAIEISENAIKYNIQLIKALQKENALCGDCNVEQTARMMHQFIQGVLLVGRIYKDIDMVQSDLLQGLYQLLGVKEELRNC